MAAAWGPIDSVDMAALAEVVSVQLEDAGRQLRHEHTIQLVTLCLDTPSQTPCQMPNVEADDDVVPSTKHLRHGWTAAASVDIQHAGW